jgi:hypothetical protein
MTRNAAAMRSIRALTVGALIASDRRKALDRQEALQELNQQFQLPISGGASAFPVWQEIEVEFSLALLDAPDMRETPYSDPIVTYGVVCGDNIAVTVNVAAWIRNDEKDVAGARQGFGAPDFIDDTED